MHSDICTRILPCLSIATMRNCIRRRLRRVAFGRHSAPFGEHWVAVCRAKAVRGGPIL